MSYSKTVLFHHTFVGFEVLCQHIIIGKIFCCRWKQGSLQYLKKNVFLIPVLLLLLQHLQWVISYILRKVEQKIACANCISPLLTKIVHKIVVELTKKISDIIQELLPSLKYNKICSQLIKWLEPCVTCNSLFSCSLHKTELCALIIVTVTKPVVDNICLEQTDSVKRKLICNKRVCRKSFKIAKNDTKVLFHKFMPKC